MKRWNSACNVQGLRVIIVVGHIGTVKICVAAVEVLMKKERQDETQFPTKIDGFLSMNKLWYEEQGQNLANSKSMYFWQGW